MQQHKISKKPGKYSTKQILTVALLAVSGSGALITAGVNAAPALTSPAVTSALQSGDLSALKTALLAQVQDRATKETAKINAMTDTDLKNMQTREAEHAAETAKTTEYETKLTDILKADSNNKDGFISTAKEYYAAMKTLEVSEATTSTDTTKPARPVMPDPTDTQLTDLYARSVTRVQAGKSVILHGGHDGEGFFGGKRAGRGMHAPTDATSSSTSSSATNVQ